MCTLLGKRGFRGESIQMKMQTLQVSGELSTFKPQLINYFAFQEAKTNERINSFPYPRDNACCSYSHTSCEHHCCSAPTPNQQPQHLPLPRRHRTPATWVTTAAVHPSREAQHHGHPAESSLPPVQSARGL